MAPTSSANTTTIITRDNQHRTVRQDLKVNVRRPHDRAELQNSDKMFERQHHIQMRRVSELRSVVKHKMLIHTQHAWKARANRQDQRETVPRRLMYVTSLLHARTY